MFGGFAGLFGAEFAGALQPRLRLTWIAGNALALVVQMGQIPTAFHVAGFGGGGQDTDDVRKVLGYVFRGEGDAGQAFRGIHIALAATNVALNGALRVQRSAASDFAGDADQEAAFPIGKIVAISFEVVERS